MKKTEENVTQPGKVKSTNPNTNPGKPQQSQRENMEKKGQTPDQRDNKKVRPEEWQATQPTEFQSKPRKSGFDFDDDVDDVDNFQDIDQEESEEVSDEEE